MANLKNGFIREFSISRDKFSLSFQQDVQTCPTTSINFSASTLMIHFPAPLLIKIIEALNTVIITT